MVTASANHVMAERDGHHGLSTEIIRQSRAHESEVTAWEWEGSVEPPHNAEQGREDHATNQIIMRQLATAIHLALLV